MAQDFAKKPSTSGDKASSKKAAPKKKRKGNQRKATPSPKKAPLWAWFVIGIGVLGFSLFLVHLSQQADQTQPTVKTSNNTAPPASQDSQVRFDFYNILKGYQVDIDKQVADNTPISQDFIYWLQTASFQDVSDAQSRRAELILLGLPAVTEKTLNKKQQTWHRVLVGPFTSRSKLAKARSILASHEINSFLIKRKTSQ